MHQAPSLVYLAPHVKVDKVEDLVDESALVERGSDGGLDLLCHGLPGGILAPAILFDVE